MGRTSSLGASEFSFGTLVQKMFESAALHFAKTEAPAFLKRAVDPSIVHTPPVVSALAFRVGYCLLSTMLGDYLFLEPGAFSTRVNG
jgi:hypothetical protein